MQLLTGRRIALASVAFSADGRYLAAGGAGGLEVWNLSGPADQPLFFSFTWVRDILPLPSGRFLFWTFHGFRLCELEDRAGTVWKIVQPARPGNAGTLSPDGKTLVTYDRFDTLRCFDWDEKRKALERRWGVPTRNRWYSPAVFLHPGDRLAVVERDEEEVERWLTIRDAATGKKREEIAWTHGVINPYPVLGTPDGSKLLVAVGSSFHVLELADLTRKPRKVVSPDRSHFADLAFHPSGRILATIGNSRDVRFWDTATWTESRSFAWKIGKLAAVAFSADGTRCAAVSHTGHVMVWDVDL